MKMYKKYLQKIVNGQCLQKPSFISLYKDIKKKTKQSANETGKFSRKDKENARKCKRKHQNIHRQAMSLFLLPILCCFFFFVTLEHIRTISAMGRCNFDASVV